MNNEINQTVDAATGALQSMLNTLSGFVPQLLAAIIILLVGWAIAAALGSLAARGLRALQADALARRFGLEQVGSRIGKPISLSGIFGWLVKWFFLVATFVAAADALELSQVSDFLYNQVFPYFGNVVIASIILVIGFLLANFLREVVADALKAAGFPAFLTVATAARWAILVFSFIAALSQLRIASSFMQDLFRALVYMLALAGGLAFGLGGTDTARSWLDSLSGHREPPLRAKPERE